MSDDTPGDDAGKSAVIEVSENFYLRATLACIATKPTDDAATLKAIAKNALDALRITAHQPARSQNENNPASRRNTSRP